MNDKYLAGFIVIAVLILIFTSSIYYWRLEKIENCINKINDKHTELKTELVDLKSIIEKG